MKICFFKFIVKYMGNLLLELQLFNIQRSSLQIGIEINKKITTYKILYS